MKRRWILLLIPCILLIFFYAGKSFFSSAWYWKKDRMNIVFYGQNTRIFSIDLTDEINYVFSFEPDTVMQVPGGYGDYRIGGLGKLAAWEKDPSVIQRTFSYNTMLMVDFYFYPRNNSVYYGSESLESANPTFSQIFFTSSNANFFDRLFVYFVFMGKGRRNFTAIPLKEKIFDRESFYKTYQGFFYQKQYRDQKANVQIMYAKQYAAATAVSGIIEGQGIRVVDISGYPETPGTCRIEENARRFSAAAKDMARFFGCTLHLGNPEISDIIIRLGEKEKKWEANTDEE